MVQTVDDDEKGIYIVYTLGGNQDCMFLTENGLYEVLMLSRKPIAKKFKKEVKRILHDLRVNGTVVAVLARFRTDPHFSENAEGASR